MHGLSFDITNSKCSRYYLLNASLQEYQNRPVLSGHGLITFGTEIQVIIIININLLRESAVAQQILVLGPCMHGIIEIQLLV